MSHIRARSPSKISESNAEKYSKLTPAALKDKYNEVYEKFANYVETYSGERLPERVVPSWFSSKTKELLDEIINMEARIRELDEIAAKAARIKDEEERKRNAARGEGYVTDHDLDIQYGMYWASRKRGELAHIHNLQREQNSRISATWCASTFITASVVVPSTATQLEFSPHVVDAGQEKRASMQRTAFGRGEHACTNPAPVALLMHV